MPGNTRKEAPRHSIGSGKCHSGGSSLRVIAKEASGSSLHSLRRSSTDAFARSVCTAYCALSAYCSSLKRSKEAALRLSGTAPSDAILHFPSTAIRQSPSPQTRSMPQRSKRSCESGPKICTSHTTVAISSLTLRKTRVSLSRPTKSDGVSATALVARHHELRTTLTSSSAVTFVVVVVGDVRDRAPRRLALFAQRRRNPRSRRCSQSRSCAEPRTRSSSGHRVEFPCRRRSGTRAR